MAGNDKSASPMNLSFGDAAAEAARLAEDGLYDPASEHDACGVGLIAAIDGQPRRDVVEAGINALKAVIFRE